MLPQNESNNSQRSTHTDPKESKAKRDASRDDLLNNPIITSTIALIHLFYEILIFTLSISNHGLTLDRREIFSPQSSLIRSVLSSLKRGKSLLTLMG